MRFVNPQKLVSKARERGYAVPAFNTNGANYDITRACLEAAQESQAPLILQVYEPNCVYRGFPYFVNLARFLCEELEVAVPVAIHLDHGRSFASVMQAIRAGFTGVMLDASHKHLEENINELRRVVQTARTLDVAVEGEVGYVKGNEPSREKKVGCYAIPEKPELPLTLTRPEEALRFVRETDVNLLAVSVGTTHGVFQRQENIDFQLLDELRRILEVPLVLHGTGGVSLEDLARCASGGMAKINFGEPFRYDYIRYFSDFAQTREHLWHTWRIMRDVKDALKEDMKQLIAALGAEGRG
ncbi:MAG: class II fructose-bisphosphate aldolase [Spirochaetaceae bacterium]|nr:MAG: class II fructose-bisphosphate aldolase [Spirochaetaceae bacterium]